MPSTFRSLSLLRPFGHDLVPQQWLAYSFRLDGYLLRQPGGEFLVGLRYGSYESDYLSPAAFSPDQQKALRALAERAKVACRVVDAARIPGAKASPVQNSGRLALERAGTLIRYSVATATKTKLRLALWIEI